MYATRMSLEIPRGDTFSFKDEPFPALSQGDHVHVRPALGTEGPSIDRAKEYVVRLVYSDNSGAKIALISDSLPQTTIGLEQRLASAGMDIGEVQNILAEYNLASIHVPANNLDVVEPHT